MSLCVCVWLCMLGGVSEQKTSFKQQVCDCIQKWTSHASPFSTLVAELPRKVFCSWASLFHLPIYKKNKILASACCYKDLPCEYPRIHCPSQWMIWDWRPLGPAARWGEASKLMWTISEDHKLAVKLLRVLYTGKSLAIRINLKILTITSFIFKSLALCWWGRENSFLFFNKELFGWEEQMCY